MVKKHKKKFVKYDQNLFGNRAKVNESFNTSSDLSVISDGSSKANESGDSVTQVSEEINTSNEFVEQNSNEKSRRATAGNDKRSESEVNYEKNLGYTAEKNINTNTNEVITEFKNISVESRYLNKRNLNSYGGRKSYGNKDYPRTHDQSQYKRNENYRNKSDYESFRKDEGFKSNYNQKNVYGEGSRDKSNLKPDTLELSGSRRPKKFQEKLENVSGGSKERVHRKEIGVPQPNVKQENAPSDWDSSEQSCLNESEEDQNHSWPENEVNESEFIENASRNLKSNNRPCSQGRELNINAKAFVPILNVPHSLNKNAGARQKEDPVHSSDDILNDSYQPITQNRRGFKKPFGSSADKNTDHISNSTSSETWDEENLSQNIASVDETRQVRSHKQSLDEDTDLVAATRRKEGYEQRTTSDDFFDNIYRPINRTKQDNEKDIDKKYQQRRGHSMGYYENKESWRNRDAKNDTLPKRRSEGGNFWDTGKASKSWDLLDRSCEKKDTEYIKFETEQKMKEEIKFEKVSEIQQDLFAMPKEYSLAHCVAEDMKMGSGIAVHFKRDFKDMDVLFNQRVKQGGLALLEQEVENNVRYVYYLVTKRVSNGKPTYQTLWSSLKKMRDHIRDHDVKKLAIPRLGCGLDRLEWSEVKHMIEFLFGDVDIEIVVCNFQQSDESFEKLLNYTCKVVHVQKSIADIEEETSIIYLSTENGHISSEMEQLGKKFQFLGEFRQARKELGDLIKYDVPKRYFVLNGCIVRKTIKDPFDFVSFLKCIKQINKNCRKEKYYYVGIQAIKDDGDDMINDKIITMLKNYLNNIDVYVCWDGDLVSQMPLPRE